MKVLVILGISDIIIKMDTLPIEIQAIFVQAIDFRTQAAMASSCRMLKTLVQKEGGLQNVNKQDKFLVVLQDLIAHHHELRPFRIEFTSNQGYVLFTLLRDHRGLAYKLDGVSNSPRFTLDDTSAPLFYKFVQRELPDVQGWSITCNFKLPALCKRLKSVFQNNTAV